MPRVVVPAMPRVGDACVDATGEHVALAAVQPKVKVIVVRTRAARLPENFGGLRKQRRALARERPVYEEQVFQRGADEEVLDLGDVRFE